MDRTFVTAGLQIVPQEEHRLPLMPLASSQGLRHVDSRNICAPFSVDSPRRKSRSYSCCRKPLRPCGELLKKKQKGLYQTWSTASHELLGSPRSFLQPTIVSQACPQPIQQHPSRSSSRPFLPSVAIATSADVLRPVGRVVRVASSSRLGAKRVIRSTGRGEP